jgi:hypothetical protein
MPCFRWAHQTKCLNEWAEQLTALPGWFPHGVHPEAFLQAVIDILCVAVTGILTRRLYQASSTTGILTPFTYPVTLVIIAVTYAFQTTHALRFVYDFPSMALFATGVYLIYFHRSAVLFAALFLVATVNRETSLFLLPLFALAQGTRSTGGSASAFQLRNIQLRPTLFVLLPLAAFWISWRHWLVLHFAHNPSASGPRLLLNLGILACPWSWPQVLSTSGYLWPFLFVYRRHITHSTLRVWLWIFPLWLLFMLRFGLILEPRIFGELIVIAVPVGLLLAEKFLLTRVASQAIQS